LKLWALGKALDISFLIRNKQSDNTEALSEPVCLKGYSSLYMRVCVNTVLIMKCCIFTETYTSWAQQNFLLSLFELESEFRFNLL